VRESNLTEKLRQISGEMDVTAINLVMPSPTDPFSTFQFAP
jgi:hypothetical protein